MVRSENKKELFDTIIDSLKNIHKLKARAEFLRKCKNLKIVPLTMIIKPLTNPDMKLNSKYMNVAKTASKNNLEIAILDSKNASKTAEIKHKNFMETIHFDEKTEKFLEKVSLKFEKQQHNKYSQKLLHLKLKHEIPIDPINPNPHKKSNKPRRFIPRKRYPQWKKFQSTKKNFELIHNFSDIKMTDSMISLLNKGPGFVPLEHPLNVTQTMADLNKYERRIRWCEYFSNEVTNLSDHIHDEQNHRRKFSDLVD